MPAQLPKAGDPKTVYVIDVSSYVFRAYHALPPLSNSKGEPTHAVVGFGQMLLKLIREHDPKVLVAAMDSGEDTIRLETFKEYKANRPPVPEDLIIQMQRVEEIIDAWGLTKVRIPRYEADDLIAAVVDRSVKAGYRVVIVSSDKDLLQLVGDDVVMYDTMRRNVFGADETREKFGVGPGQMRDLLALTGDSSDNIPGVPSIGPKTAAKLLEEFSTLEGIYKNLDKIKANGTRTKLRDYKSNALLSQRLVTLLHDLPMDFSPTTSAFSGKPTPKLLPLLKELDLRRLAEQLGQSAAANLASEAPESNYKQISTRKDLKELVEFLLTVQPIAIATHLDAPDAMLGAVQAVAFSTQAGEAYGISFLSQKEISLQDFTDALRPWLENSLFFKVGDAKREWKIWNRHSVNLRGMIFDPELVHYVLDPGRQLKGLAELTRQYLDLELPNLEGIDPCTAASTQADYALRLVQSLQARLSEGELGNLFTKLELPLARVLGVMESHGVLVDVRQLEERSKDVAQDLERLEKQAIKLAGHDFNLGSPRQLEAILFDELKLPVVKRTATARSTDQDVLEELALAHELPQLILEYRQLSKIESTYLDALPTYVNPNTGRIHTQFNQGVASTGRLSSSDPNLQNIPIRSELGREIRKAFITSPGWKILSVDYSQIELRVLAHLSRDAELASAFQRDVDVHTATATALFNVKPEDVTKEMRGRAKTVNFAVIYGQSQFALARNLRIEQAEAKKYIEAFFERYSGVADYMEALVEESKERGYVTTLLGRRRAFPDLVSPNGRLRAAAERAARNAPIQGSAADIMKLAMLRIDDALRRDRVNARMLLTVHDELVFEAPESEIEKVAQIARHHMENAIKLDVPVTVEVGVGNSWGEAH